MVVGAAVVVVGAAVVVVVGAAVVVVVEPAVVLVVGPLVVVVVPGVGGVTHLTPPVGTWAWASMCPTRTWARWLVGSGTRSFTRTASTAPHDRVPSSVCTGPAGPGGVLASELPGTAWSGARAFSPMKISARLGWPGEPGITIGGIIRPDGGGMTTWGGMPGGVIRMVGGSV